MATFRIAVPLLRLQRFWSPEGGYLKASGRGGYFLEDPNGYRKNWQFCCSSGYFGGSQYKCPELQGNEVFRALYNIRDSLFLKKIGGSFGGPGSGGGVG